MIKLTRYILSFVFVLAFFAGSKAQFYTGSHQDFGKNRVQHINFGWQYHDYQRFRIFFYGGEKTQAQYVARSVHKNLSRLEEFFDNELDEKIDILVFNKYSDFKQSNIGLTNDIKSNIGGKTQIIGNKLFVYFEEDHPTFDNNIRKALSELIVAKLLYGGDWKKVLRTSATLKLPEWFDKGLYSFCGENWNTEIDNIVKDGILSGKYEKLNLLEGEDAIYAGHSLWNYIHQVYGKEYIPHIVYMVNVSRNFESGFRFVLGESTKTLVDNWLNYYKKQYEADENQRNLPHQEKIELKKKKKRGKITQVKMHPFGNKIAYVTNDLGKYKIWVYDLQTKEYTKIAKGSFKVNRKTDDSYPILAFTPTGDQLTYIEEKQGVVNITSCDLEGKGKYTRILMGLSKVFDFQYNPKGDYMIFSALKKGQVDLFYYNVKGNSYKQLTDDIYDDLNPRFIENGSKIIFASNRKNDSLLKDVEVKPFNFDYDIFIYDPGDKKMLKQVTNTPGINESQPYEIERLKYTYLADDNGIVNRYIASYDSVISSVDTAIHYRFFSKSSIVTNYKRNILKIDYNKRTDDIAVLMLHDGAHKIFTGKANLDKMLSSDDVLDTYYQNVLNTTTDTTSAVETDISIVTIIEENNQNKVVDVSNYQFEDTPPKVTKEKISKNETQDTKEFKLGIQKEYRTNFVIDNLTSQLDQSFLNNSYQLFNPGAPFFNNPSFNMFTMVELKDLMEDYRVIGGVNLNFDLIDNNYLASFEDLKSRIDKKYLFVRQSYSSQQGNFPIKTRTHEFKYRLKYPFNEVSAVATTFSYRNDNSIVASIDRASLNAEGFSRNLGGFKVEYIFDNTFEKGLNLMHGTRFKLFGEFYHQLTEKETDFYVVGADFRHYEKIHKDLIFAGRFAASTSFGNQKLVYYMGGVDNWLLPKFNQNAVIPTDKGFTYQTIATPMRGFIQNTRFGNSFAVVNAELRWPVFRYFSKYPIQNTFFDNFQILGFGDAGTAWTGSNPYSEENSFNKTIISQKPLVIELENQREPIILGYGIGVRSQLFGYFIRFDWAWGVEDGVTQKSIRYLSLSLDF